MADFMDRLQKFSPIQRSIIIDALERQQRWGQGGVPMPNPRLGVSPDWGQNGVAPPNPQFWVSPWLGQIFRDE